MSITQPQATPSPMDAAEDEIPIGAGLDFTDPNSPLARYYRQTSHVVAAALLATVFILLNRVPLWHTDIWGHLAYGRVTALNWWPPSQEQFCTVFADPDAPGAQGNWLAQTGFYLAYATGAQLATWTGADPMAGGVDVLRMAYACLVNLKLLLLYLAFVRLTGSPGWACGGLAVVILLSLGNLAVIRPQVIGEVGVATLLFALSLKEIPKRFTFTLPLLMTVWANAHGSFLMGLMVLGLGTLGRMIEVVLRTGSLSPATLWRDVSVRRLLLILIISVVAIALQNPSGPWIYAQALATARHPNVLAMDEWQPLKFTLGPGGHWAYAMTLLLVVGAVVAHRRWFTPTQTLLLAFLVWQPLVHQRMFVWWLLACPWIVLPHYAAWGRAWAKNREIGGVPSLRKTLLVGMILFLAVMMSLPLQWLLNGQPTELKRSLSDGTPLTFAQELLKTPPPGRVFASETLADFLLWNAPTPQRICVYTHVHLFPADHWKWCQVVKFGQKNWRDVLDRWQVNTILVEAESHPHLRQRLQDDKEWEILLDETGDTKKIDKRCRLLLAKRKQPILK